MIEFQLDGKLLFTNISRLPISVSKVIYEILLMRPIRCEVCKPFVLNAGEAKEIDISIFGLTSDFFDGIIDNEFGEADSSC